MPSYIKQWVLFKVHSRRPVCILSNTVPPETTNNRITRCLRWICDIKILIKRRNPAVVPFVCRYSKFQFQPVSVLTKKICIAIASRRYLPIPRELPNCLFSSKSLFIAMEFIFTLSPVRFCNVRFQFSLFFINNRIGNRNPTVPLYR